MKNILDIKLLVLKFVTDTKWNNMDKVILHHQYSKQFDIKFKLHYSGILYDIFRVNI